MHQILAVMTQVAIDKRQRIVLNQSTSLADYLNTRLGVDRVNTDVIEERVWGSALRAAEHEVPPQGWRLGSTVTHAKKIATGRLTRFRYLVADPADRLLRNAVEIDLAVAVPPVLSSRWDP